MVCLVDPVHENIFPAGQNCLPVPSYIGSVASQSEIRMSLYISGKIKVCMIYVHCTLYNSANIESKSSSTIRTYYFRLHFFKPKIGLKGSRDHRTRIERPESGRYSWICLLFIWVADGKQNRKRHLFFYLLQRCSRSTVGCAIRSLPLAILQPDHLLNCTTEMTVTYSKIK